MSLLNYDELIELADILLISQKVKARDALCLRIGIDPTQLPFTRDGAERDFVIQIINYLNQINEQEALCKLCCKELIPILHKGKYGLFLSELVEKLNCSQEFKQNFPNNKQPTSSSSSPSPNGSVNPFNQLAKNKLVIGSAIFIIGLAGAGYRLFTNNYNGNKLGQTWIEYESGVTSTWQRIEGNKFKSRWIQPETGKEQTADLNIDISNNSVEIERTNSTDGINCNYTGKLGKTGKTVNGDFNCDGRTGQWYATIGK